MVNVVGESIFLNGNDVKINVLGNHLPKDHRGYNDCLSIRCNNREQAWEIYCKAMRIIANKQHLKFGKDMSYYVNYENCKIEYLTKYDVENEIQKHKNTYKW